jgi:hypothetical protein
VLIHSCKRENPCENYNLKSFSFKLKEDTKKQIPYNGTETLTFIGNDNDTAILIGQEKIIIFNQVELLLMVILSVLNMIIILASLLI